MSSKITLHVEAEHTCGHMHKSIYHMDVATIDVLMKAEYSKFEIAQDFVMQTEAKQERSLKLSGSFDKIEVHMCPCVLGLKRFNWMQKLCRQFANRLRRKRDG